MTFTLIDPRGLVTEENYDTARYVAKVQLAHNYRQFAAWLRERSEGLWASSPISWGTLDEVIRELEEAAE